MQSESPRLVEVSPTLRHASAGVMERSNVTQTGITFGNNQAGAGTAELTAQTAGSAGVMERSGVQKTGITFGNSGL